MKQLVQEEVEYVEEDEVDLGASSDEDDLEDYSGREDSEASSSGDEAEDTDTQGAETESRGGSKPVVSKRKPGKSPHFIPC